MLLLQENRTFSCQLTEAKGRQKREARKQELDSMSSVESAVHLDEIEGDERGNTSQENKEENENTFVEPAENREFSNLQRNHSVSRAQENTEGHDTSEENNRGPGERLRLWSIIEESKASNEEFINKIGSIKYGIELRIENYRGVTTALLDTGSSGNFLSFQVVKKNNIRFCEC